MSDSSARTIAAAIVFASVVAAFAVVFVDKENEERHYERMFFDCMTAERDIYRVAFERYAVDCADLADMSTRSSQPWDGVVQ
tara:strand:+ start:278 stop:523 length:246 start_codon:yes stop_codon:yes gene_type:complete